MNLLLTLSWFSKYLCKMGWEPLRIFSNEHFSSFRNLQESCHYYDTTRQNSPSFRLPPYFILYYLLLLLLLIFIYNFVGWQNVYVHNMHVCAYTYIYIDR